MEVFLLFLLGISVGSFLGVVIDRLPNDEPIAKGRSYCDHCKKTLQWYMLIPLFSFLLQGAKSRCCRKKLSWKYPGIELLTGVLFVGTILYVRQDSSCWSNAIASPSTLNGILSAFGFQNDIICVFQRSLSSFFNLFVVSSLIALFFIDLKHSILPDKIVYPLIVISFLFLLFTFQQNCYIWILNHPPALAYAEHWRAGVQDDTGCVRSHLLSPLLSAAGAFLFFLLIHVATRGKGMGMGDVKLSIFMGFFLGFPNIVVALYIAFLTGAVISIILIVEGKKKLKGGTIPFGPFLILGTFAAWIWGEQIVQMVLRWLY